MCAPPILVSIDSSSSHGKLIEIKHTAGISVWSVRPRAAFAKIHKTYWNRSIHFYGRPSTVPSVDGRHLDTPSMPIYFISTSRKMAFRPMKRWSSSTPNSRLVQVLDVLIVGVVDVVHVVIIFFTFIGVSRDVSCRWIVSRRSFSSPSSMTIVANCRNDTRKPSSVRYFNRIVVRCFHFGHNYYRVKT